jgi:hypothetical protein
MTYLPYVVSLDAALALAISIFVLEEPKGTVVTLFKCLVLGAECVFHWQILSSLGKAWV